MLSTRTRCENTFYWSSLTDKECGSLIAGLTECTCLMELAFQTLPCFVDREVGHNREEIELNTLNRGVYFEMLPWFCFNLCVSDD